MANLVPKVNNVGSLGTSSKLWNEVHQTTSVYGTGSITEESNVLKVKDAPLTIEQGLTVAGSSSLASATMTGTLSMGSQRITNLGTPSADSDAVTKVYVDSAIQGLDIKESARAATTAAITLASDLENGDTIDGITLVTGDRVLVKDQSTASENGIYIVAASGAPARSSDFAASDAVAGSFVFIEEGTVNADSGFVCTSNSGSDVVGTDSLSFTQFSGAVGIVGGDGLTKSGSTLSVNVDDTTIEINADTLRLKAASITNSYLDASVITGQTAEATADDADSILIYDSTASALRKMTRANFLSGIGGGAAADDITIGDAAVNISTISGNITIDAQGDNTDIIFKGTDGGVDITMLTLDGSAAGTATFNNDIRLLSNNSAITFGATAEVSLLHLNGQGLQMDLAGAGLDEPKFSLKSSSDVDRGPLLEFYHFPANGGNGDVIGSLGFLGKAAASYSYTYCDVRGIINNVNSNDWRGQLDFRVIRGAANSMGTALSIAGNNAGGSTVDISDHDGASEGLKLGGTLITSTASELNALDISVQSPSDNEVLTYTAASGLHWAAAAGGGGGGSVPAITSASPSSTYTISTATGIEEVFLLTPSVNITVNLPAAATAGSGYKYQIKNLSTNTITIDPNSTETVDGSATFALSSQYSSVTVICDGSNWFII